MRHALRHLEPQCGVKTCVKCMSKYAVWGCSVHKTSILKQSTHAHQHTHTPIHTQTMTLRKHDFKNNPKKQYAFYFQMVHRIMQLTITNACHTSLAPSSLFEPRHPSWSHQRKMTMTMTDSLKMDPTCARHLALRAWVKGHDPSKKSSEIWLRVER